MDYRNCILAPNDASPNFRSDQIFKNQLSFDDQTKIEHIIMDFGNEIFDSYHMLNCIWVYDTSILNICNKTQLLDAMNKYPLCRCNEMTIMNILFHLKLNVWERMPQKIGDRYIFNWSDVNFNRGENVQLTDFVCLKYPSR